MSDEYSEEIHKKLEEWGNRQMPSPEVVRTVTLQELTDGNISIAAEHTNPLKVEQILTQALLHIKRQIDAQVIAHATVQLIKNEPPQIMRPGSRDL